MVNFDRFLDGLRLFHNAAPVCGIKRRFDQGRNTGKSKPAIDKLAYGDLICSVQNRRCTTPGCKGAACDACDKGYKVCVPGCFKK